MWYQVAPEGVQGMWKNTLHAARLYDTYKALPGGIIEAVIDDTDISFAIEESTIYRWKRWFRNIKEQLNSNLRAVRQAERRVCFTRCWATLPPYSKK